MSNVDKQPAWQVAPKLRSRARSLRRDSTDAERAIWNELRAHRMNGASFRRQTPIGPYVVDFVCHAANLVVELNGGQHFEPEHMKRDARRDAFLVSKGLRVLRFNNHDVMTSRQGVLETVAVALADAPSLSLPHKGGGNPRTTARRGASPSPPLPRRRGRESRTAIRDAAVGEVE
jgi:very-short-patch-repair endonuclease